jgi:hypothetical protein
MLPEPPFVEGGAWRFDPTCWCAALSSWQAVTPNRTQETKEVIEARMNKLGALKKTAQGQPTLDAGKFDVFASAKNIQMVWRPVRGNVLFHQWNLEMFLSVYGYMYMVMMVGDSEYAGGMISHARVLFGASEAFKVAYFIDPAKKRVVADYKSLVGGRYLVGFAQEYSSLLNGDGWINEKPA